jgi:hypothetical protein
MDNDREIKPDAADDAPGTHLVEQTKAYFLKAAIDDFRTAQERYNLNDEFAKTRKNRSFVVLAAISATVVAFGLFAFLFNNYVDAKSNQVGISTQEFDDINLRDILDKATVIENDLALQKAQLKILDDDLAKNIEKAKGDSNDQLALFRSTNPKAADLQAKSEELAKNLETRIQAITLSAAKAKKPTLDRIDELGKQLAAFDPRKLEVAKKQEVVLNNERRVYNIERDRMQALLGDQIKQLGVDYGAQLKKRDAFIRDLETSAHATLVREQERLKLLYNPILTDDQSLRLLGQPVDNQRFDRYAMRLPVTYEKAGVIPPARIAQANQSLADYDALIKTLNQVPYTNSIPDVLSQLRYRTLVAIDAVTGMFDDFWKVVLAREATIAEREATIAARDATIVEKEATIADREATLKVRDKTIADREATIQENMAAIAEREATIREKDLQNKDLQKTMNERIDQERASYASLLASCDSFAQASNADGVVLNSGDPSSLIVYLRPSVTVAPGARFYVMRNGSDVVEEYQLVTTSPLARFAPVPAAARTKLAATQSTPTPAKIVFAGKGALAMDWVIRVENYAAWKVNYARNPVR